MVSAPAKLWGDDPVTPSKPISTRDLLRYVLRESDLLRSPVFLYVIGASGSRTALIYLVNRTAENGGATPGLLLALVVSVLVMLATSHFAKISGIILVQRLTQKMRHEIGRKILAADVGFFQRNPQAELFHATTAHVSNVAQSTLHIAEIAQAVLLLLFCLGYMFFEVPAAVIATVLAFLFGVAAFFATERPASRAVRKSHQASVDFHSSVHDMLGGYKELRLRRERRQDLARRLDQQIGDCKDLTVEAERHYSYGQIGANAALTLLLVSIVVVLPLISDATSVTMLQVLTLVLFSFSPIEVMVGDLPLIARATISYRLYEALKQDLDQNAEPSEAPQPQDRPGFQTLELRDVVVHLTRDVGEDGTAKDRFTLGPINLVLRPGQSVFIAGGNGMGKSTLLQLLTGLRHPDAGQILVDGVPVTGETLAEYRGLFSAVFSEFYLFRYLYGMTGPELDRLGTHIAELGLTEGVAIQDRSLANLALSTGQKRRLALSIALAEERPIIVLDEFAADQDPERRAFFYDVLVPRLAKNGHCVVAVTHDEHCFDKADRLIRVEDGQIVDPLGQDQDLTGGQSPNTV